MCWDSKAARGKSLGRQSAIPAKEEEYSYITVPRSTSSLDWWCLLPMYLTLEDCIWVCSNNANADLLSHLMTVGICDNDQNTCGRSHASSNTDRKCRKTHTINSRSHYSRVAGIKKTFEESVRDLHGNFRHPAIPTQQKSRTMALIHRQPNPPNKRDPSMLNFEMSVALS